MKPSDLYHALVHHQSVQPSALQLAVLCDVMDPYFSVLSQSLRRSIWHRLRFVADQRPGAGIYLWGGVGTGKTMLMDLLDQALCRAGIKVWKVHFNTFMRTIHDQLHGYAGQKNPLAVVVRRLTRSYAVLCLDEFFVEDIADAMILAQLLQALLQHRVTIMITSNTAPKQLYADGLQRSKFLPAIHLLQDQLQVVRLDAVQDYRLGSFRPYTGNKKSKSEGNKGKDKDKDKGTEESIREDLPKIDSYFYGTHSAQQTWMLISKVANQQIQQFTPGTVWVQARPLDFLLRLTLSKAAGNLMIMFDFAVLCGAGRSVRDYLELAGQCAVVILWNVPILRFADEDKARRLIALIDELYQQKVKLIIQAEVRVDQLYQGVLLQHAFLRTISRIRQMCAPAYWYV